MKRREKSDGADQELMHILRQWQELEMKAIKGAGDLADRSNNPIVKMIMGLIVHDSEKHRLVQQMIIDTLTKEALHISTDELNELGKGLDSHVAAEEEAVKFARAALDKCSLVSTHFLLSYLIDDEEKHHTMLTRLRDFREASIPTSTGARL